MQPTAPSGYLSSQRRHADLTTEPSVYDIIAILIPIVLAVCAVMVVRIVVDARLRRRISETQNEADTIKALLEAGDGQRQRASTFWSLQLILLGLAMFIAQWLSLGPDDPMAYGLLFVASGLGVASSRLIPPR